MSTDGNNVQGKKSYWKVLIVFIVMCIFVAGFCMSYYKSLHATIRGESEKYLQEVARRIGSNIDRIINDNFAVLYTVASVLENDKNMSLGEAQVILKKQQEYWDYDNIMLVDETGNSYDINNKQTFVSLDNDMRADLLKGKETMSHTQVINNREFIFFFVPLDNFWVNGKKMVALAASYDPADFDQVLSMKSFDEQAYSQIVTKNGAIVTRSSSPYAMKTGYNLFNSIKEAKLDGESKLSVMEEDIKEDRNGQIGFMLDGEHRYMVYTPINPEEWYLMTFVPVKVINEKSDALLKTTLLICSFIAFAFAGLCATIVYIFNKNKRNLEQIAYVDDITGGNTIQKFYKEARELLDNSNGRGYAMVYSNIEKFKILNEQLGRQNCDTILKVFNEYIEAHLTEGEYCGRISADNFCILLEFTDEQELETRFRKWRVDADSLVVDQKMQWGLPSLEFGVYVIENIDLDFPQMIDRAKLALKENAWTIDSKFHFAFYDDSARRRLFREKQLEDKMEEALENIEFEVYLQPKYSLPDEKIGGAEALVRWINPEEGMIYPNEFIPLFEKNGFIVNLDLWVFEEVCRTIKRWKAENIQPIKISVNCSRIHFKVVNFLDPYIKIANEYGIKRNEVEIELTESIVFENSERLIEIISMIQSAGFGCSMDDFGSGYSSLNMIQNIPVDTLKLDRIFFNPKSSDALRTEAVVKNIVGMAQALNMETVAEGVEQVEQVEMLKRAGCDYIQGYVFAKPMPIAQFEELAFKMEQ